MSLVFHLPPAVTYRAPAENPAEQLATTGNFEFGLTIPKYNGIEITGLQAQHVPSPNIQITQGNLVVAGQTFNARARVTAVPTHNIAWPLFLPPDPARTGGIWTSMTKITGRQLIEKLEIVLASRGEVGKPLKPAVDFRTNRSLISARNAYTIHVKPMPSAAEFMAHIHNHELQHAADHRWLAERIIGWWDDWLTELMVNNIDVVTKDGLGGLSVASGFGYSTGFWRIISYWCRAASQSGNLYHASTQGTRAVLNLTEITDNSVTVTVTAREIIRTAPNLRVAQPHREMTFTNWNLNGNEPALIYGAEPANRLRSSDWRKLDATHWARR